MLIYLFIAAEIAILYSVFWYMFVRDPEPYKIIGDPWGKYGQSNSTTSNTTNNADKWWHHQESPINSSHNLTYDANLHSARSNSLPYGRGTQQKFPHDYLSAKEYEEPEEQKEEALIFRIWNIVRTTLDALNVKRP